MVSKAFRTTSAPAEFFFFFGNMDKLINKKMAAFIVFLFFGKIQLNADPLTLFYTHTNKKLPGL